MKSRKRKTPVTDQASSSSSSNPRSSRALIRRFHVLLKKKAQLQAQGVNVQNSTQTLAEIEEGIEALGGLSAYQRMSDIGQGDDRGGGSQKVLVSWLKAMGMSDRAGKNRLRLLEVGALKPDNYRSCSSWVDCTPIDLRSRHPSITEQDFLLMDEDKNREMWDVISLSLVLNFVPEPKDRGRMLMLAHTMLSQGGHLFLVLPLPCVQNSRYLTCEHLKALLAQIGFIEIEEKCKSGGRMAYLLFQKVGASGETRSGRVETFLTKKVLQTGKNRNNFCILL